jgi:ribosomal protein L40E
MFLRVCEDLLMASESNTPNKGDRPTFEFSETQQMPSLRHFSQQSVDEEMICSDCHAANTKDAGFCSQCGAVWGAVEQTKQLRQDASTGPTNWPTGDVIATNQQSITLEIGEHLVEIPTAEVVTLGRGANTTPDPTPHVNLTPYGAGDKGVSRRHIKITRKQLLIYVADLGSTNGTVLNNRRLIPGAERLLRNGDELALGQLKIKVKF